MRKLINKLTILSVILLLAGCNYQPVHDRPNVVFLLVDDLGWTDLACYGSSFYETPNIDKLASQGMLFTNAYAAASICSPTRASILTGKHPARVDITDWIPGLDPKNRPLLGTQDLDQLPLKEVTMAEAFKSSGYRTGFFGKWHLGSEGFFPENQGFDLNVGGNAAGQPASYFYPYMNDRKHWDVPGLDGGQEGEYLTDRLTSESIDFMSQNQGESPFLLYMAYYNVHTPIEARPDLHAKYQEKLSGMSKPTGDQFVGEREAKSKLHQDNPKYAAMVESVDESVGRLMSYLEENGLDENTIVVFTSDNGGLTTLSQKGNPPTSVKPLRAGKGWLYEGGIRVPAMFRWSGKIKPGSQSAVPIVSTDFLPTLVEMTGLGAKEDQQSASPDGESLVPILYETGEIEREALYWHFPHYHGSLNRPSAAIRSGDFKLIQWFESDSLELYNLASDLGESQNLVDALPKKTAELKRLLSTWQKDINANFPTENPDYKAIEH